MRGKIICPKCRKYGRLERQIEDKYRVNHDSKGIIKRCYLGSLEKALSNLTSVSVVRDDFIEPSLVSELKSAIKKERAEHSKRINDSEYGSLIASVIHSSRMFGRWKSDTHKLTKQDTCPHCKKNIQYEFTRIGPFRSAKKNIENFSIGKGSVYKTSGMREF